MSKQISAGRWLVIAVACAWGWSVGAAPVGSGEGKLPSLEQLPVIKELPDPFTFRDGSKVKTREDWERRRAELKEMILFYEFGPLPPEGPEDRKVTAEEVWSRGHGPRDTEVERRVLLSMGPGGKLRVPLDLTIPKGKGPFPVIVKGD